MISLAVNLARSVGFRGAVRTLHVFFQWLGIDRAIPGRTSIRNWLQRLGIDEIKQPLDFSESLVIMVDHSNQIGTEKVMLALGVNAAAMPEPGNALTHEHVRVLEAKPGDSWKAPRWSGNTKRLPMSTEILESSFGLYKQLEREHSKSGFTSLLACLPALLKPTTPERVKVAFARTSAEDVTAWTEKHFPSTVTSRRHAAHAEHQSALKRATAEAGVL